MLAVCSAGQPYLRAGPTGESLLPGTDPLLAHCTERHTTLQAQGFVLMCVLGVVGSDWLCLRLLDKRVAVRVSMLCPMVKCNPACLSHQCF